MAAEGNRWINPGYGATGCDRARQTNSRVFVPHLERPVGGIDGCARVRLYGPRPVELAAERRGEARDEILFAHRRGLQRPRADFRAYFLRRALTRGGFEHFRDEHGEIRSRAARSGSGHGAGKIRRRDFRRRPSQGELRADERTRRRPDDKIRGGKIDSIFGQSGEQARFPGDSDWSSTAEHQRSAHSLSL